MDAGPGTLEDTTCTSPGVDLGSSTEIANNSRLLAQINHLSQETATLNDLAPQECTSTAGKNDPTVPDEYSLTVVPYSAPNDDSSSYPDELLYQSNPQLRTMAFEELGEEPETRHHFIEILKEKILMNGALSGRTDDSFLLRFLRARKFDVEKAYKLYVNYYRIRAKYEEYFKGLTLESVSGVMRDHVITVLPLPDEEGRRLLYFRPGRWSVTDYDVYDILKANVLTLEKLIEDEATQIAGVILVADFNGVSFSHIRNVEHKYIKITTSVIQDAFPMRLKAFHCLNEPYGFHLIFDIVKFFLKEKMRKRINMHGGNVKSLHEKICTTLLPEELGGNLGPAEALAVQWHEEMLLSAESLSEIFKETAYDSEILLQEGSTKELAVTDEKGAERIGTVDIFKDESESKNCLDFKEDGAEELNVTTERETEQDENMNIFKDEADSKDCLKF